MIRIPKKLMYVVAFIYFSLLIYLMFFAFDRAQLLTKGQLHYDFSVNSIPLYMPNSLNWYDIKAWALDAGNLLLFIPIGIIIPSLRKTNFISFILFFLVIITVAETVQMFTNLGVFDIKDILVNLIGATIGYWCYKLSTHNDYYDIVKIICMSFTLAILITSIATYINNNIL
ncbi:VanZ family protein [Mycoplasma sp. P36-A1]|uniref:VanZ family protein n=1 Tax=Mycoplasma sp. P36-A1 TaxID=3252900 RepID=UPI003C2AFE47